MQEQHAETFSSRPETVLPTSRPMGVVHLVGAGPGSLELATLKARRLIGECDALVYDYLVNPAMLEWAKAGCRKICVGKKPGASSCPQEKIEQLLMDLAVAGFQVVRLKGGDPGVFGRGGEESLFLRRHGVPYEIVPGVTAALAAAAYAGIPLTLRSVSSALAMLSGHEDPGKGTPTVDWRAYGRSNATLCLYMAMGRLARILDELMAGGMPPETPAVAVQAASMPSQQTCTATVGTLAAETQRIGLGSPAIVIIGGVVKLEPSLSWYDI